MINTQSKSIIVQLLQKSLAGELKPNSNFKPVALADAIVDKVEFNRTYGETCSKKLSETLETLIGAILSMEEEMKEELNSLGDDEKLLANFIKGRSTSHKMMLELLNKIK